jgi:enamine deaminase RidA (YjgF/YER057c/UK114 family)
VDGPNSWSDVKGPAAMADPGPFELHSPTDLAAGFPYAYAAVTGDTALLVFTAGACPLDDAGTTVAPGDVAAQARSAMGNLHQARTGPGRVSPTW